MLAQLLEHLDKGEWVQVKREAERLMLIPELDPRTLGVIYRAGGRACIGLGEFHASVKIYELGLPYALRAKDWDTLGFIRHDLGGASLVLGDRDSARDHFVAYLMDLHRYTEARRLEGRAHYNLGLLYRQKKEYGLAIAAYGQALNCFVQRGETRNTGDCHQNIAWMYLVQQRPDKARLHIDVASTFQEKLPDDFRTEQLILLGFYHAVLGEARVAHQYLQPVIAGGLETSQEHLASAKWVEAQIHLTLGKTDEAQAALQQAWETALSAKASHLIDLCVDLQARIKAQLGETAL